MTPVIVSSKELVLDLMLERNGGMAAVAQCGPMVSRPKCFNSSCNHLPLSSKKRSYEPVESAQQTAELCVVHQSQGVPAAAAARAFLPQRSMDVGSVARRTAREGKGGEGRH